MLTEQTVTRTLRRLHGLDISPFSVSLAQIQLLWHNIELFTGKTPAEIRALAAAMVPAIQVQGGHSRCAASPASRMHSAGSWTTTKPPSRCTSLGTTSARSTAHT